MARCGCSGSVCNCVVTAGANTTVTGSGTPASPYVVSTTNTPVTVTDTPTVDLTITGQDIQAAVKLDPAPGNLITATASGLRVDCAAISACGPFDVLTVVDTPSVDLTLSGLGTLASPWVLSAVAAGGGGTVTTADTPTVNLSAGTSPLTADVILDPSAQNLAVATASGVLVDLITGCGLSGAGNLASPLIVAVSGVWPFACDENTLGGKVYCAPNGTLVVDPEKFVLVRHLIQAIVGGATGTPQPLVNFIDPADGGTGTLHSFPVDNTLHPLGVTGDLVITNPSTCRPMQLEVEYGLSHYALRVDGPGRTNVQVTAALSAAGGVAFGTQIGNAHNQNFSNNLAGFTGGSSMDILWDTGTTYPLNLAPAALVLPPGGSTTFTITAEMKVPNFAANGENSSLTMEAFVRVFGWSL